MTDILQVPKGYRFRFDGKAKPTIEDAPLPADVRMSLMHATGALLQPRAQTGQTVRTGEIVAASDDAPAVKLLAPITGRVSEVVQTHGKRRRLKPGCIAIERTGDDWVVIPNASATPEEIPADRARQMLVDGGLWPCIGQQPANGALARLDAQPQAVVVKCVAAEPFVARGHALLAGQVEKFERALAMLQRVAAPTAKIHLVLTQPAAPLAEQIVQATKGRAWVRVHFVPVVYPVENDGYLRRVLLADEPADLCAWFVDVQSALAIGACLAEGRPCVERVLAVAGPSVASPIHVRARIGTRVGDVLDGRLVEGEHRLIRGGLLTGRKAEADDGVGPLDVALNALPEGREREFMGFVRPGGDRDSFARAFLSKLWPDRPVACHTNLRGEPRPCVSCGFCEDVCPADIMPHWIYKCLVTDRLEEAERTGLDRCIECGLCSYVCPSKIELLSELRAGKQRVEEENAE